MKMSAGASRCWRARQKNLLTWKESISIEAEPADRERDDANASQYHSRAGEQGKMMKRWASNEKEENDWLLIWLNFFKKVLRFR